LLRTCFDLIATTNDKHQVKMIKIDGQEYHFFSVAMEMMVFSARH